MPVYEYVCRTCDSHFEIRRSMQESSAPVECPGGHDDTTRLLSVFASVGRASVGRASVGRASAGQSASFSASSGTGGCCGGACACGF
jgi:putative FmdB family regulatory protein